MATDLIQILRKAGFTGDALKTAYGIAMRESGGRADAFNPDRSTGDQSYGLFQINMLGNLGPSRRQQYGLKSNEQLLDALTNARVAYRMSRGGKDFGAWGIGPNAYRSGAGFDTIAKYVNQFPGAVSDLQGSQMPNANPTLSYVRPEVNIRDVLAEAIRQRRWSLDSSLGYTTSLIAEARRAAEKSQPVRTRTRAPATATSGLFKPTEDGWAGSYSISRRLASIGLKQGLAVTSEKRDRKMTASGGVSDHWVGSKNAYAFDISGNTKNMDRAARQILRRLGVKWDGKSSIVLNKTVGKHRIQILYRTKVGGNHYDHIHVGVKKL